MGLSRGTAEGLHGGVQLVEVHADQAPTAPVASDAPVGDHLTHGSISYAEVLRGILDRCPSAGQRLGFWVGTCTAVGCGCGHSETNLSECFGCLHRGLACGDTKAFAHRRGLEHIFTRFSVKQHVLPLTGVSVLLGLEHRANVRNRRGGVEQRHRPVSRAREERNGVENH